MINNAIVYAIDFSTSVLSKPFGIISLVVLISLIVWRCYMEPDFIAWVFFGVIGIPFLYLAIYSMVVDAEKKEEWKEWASKHCQIIEKKEGSVSLETGVGVSTSGKAGTGVFTNSTPDQTAYKCDDGVTYWKND
ncbi:hypothetical protein EWG95_17580 [Salmonella enterica subsp. enterica serovar Pomona]|nr:hypothetical protein [Salmonella enterica subsp. enterica serovar Pomona]